MNALIKLAIKLCFVTSGVIFKQYLSTAWAVDGNVITTILYSRLHLSPVSRPTYHFSLPFQDFNRVVKFYNRIATVLVKYEELFLLSWKSQIDAVKVGLKAPLLRLLEGKKIEVNVEERYDVLELRNQFQRRGCFL